MRWPVRLGGALVGAALLGACALDTSATSAWEAVETDLRSPSVVISPAARASSARPTVLVYLAGHLRTFLLIAPQMKALLDSMAGGPDGYVVYMHTWDELDHRDAVWWRRKAEADPARVNLRPPDVAASLSDPTLNALFADRRFVARVDSHPGSAAISQKYGTAALNAQCGGHGLKCIDHTAAQLHELHVTHALARAHLRSLGAWPMDRGAGAGARTDGGERTPVIKSRPDVLLSEGWKAHASIGRMAKAFGSSLGERRCLGHSGPWPGGWGDIAWVMPLGAVQVVLDATTASRLAPLLLDDAAGDFRTYRPLVSAKAAGEYHAEQAWREILIKAGVRSFVTGWFAGLAKARLARLADGRLGIDKWHCYRAKAWQELGVWLRAKGFALEWAPVAPRLAGDQ